MTAAKGTLKHPPRILMEKETLSVSVVGFSLAYVFVREAAKIVEVVPNTFPMTTGNCLAIDNLPIALESISWFAIIKSMPTSNIELRFDNNTHTPDFISKITFEIEKCFIEILKSGSNDFFISIYNTRAENDAHNAEILT